MAKRRALRGDPFALIGLLWPELVVTDPEDAKHLQGKVQLSENDEEQTWLDPCLRLDFWQRDGIRSVFDPSFRQVMTKGCTKAGKGAWTSIAICLWWYLFDPCKIVIVGPNFEHVKSKSMLPEVKRFLRQMTDQRETVINAESINWPGSEDKFISVGNAESDEGFSGIHGRHTLVVFDESSDIRDGLFQQAKTFAKMIIALSNPRSHSGWFRDCFGPPALDPDETQSVQIASGQRRLITVSGTDCVNVKSGLEIIPGQLTKEVFAEVMDPKGKAAWWPRCMGLGKFPDDDTETMLFTPNWLERCEKRHSELKASEITRKPRAFGFDVGASRDGDPSCLAAIDDYGIIELHMPEKTGDTMAQVGWVVDFCKRRYGIDLTNGLTPIEIDVIGPGKGVYDKMKERGCLVLRSNEVSKNKIAKQMYANHRAERYGELSRRLDPEGEFAAEPFSLPTNTKLREELLAHEKFYKSTGQFRITPKKKKPGDRTHFAGQTIFEKLGRSPDHADAVVYAYSAYRTLNRRKAPRVNRDLNVGTSFDDDKPRREFPRFEDLPEPKLSPTEIEPVETIAWRIAQQMDWEDDCRWH